MPNYHIHSKFDVTKNCQTWMWFSSVLTSTHHLNDVLKIKWKWCGRVTTYLPLPFCCGADTMHIPCKAGTRRHLHLVTPPWQCCLQWHHERRDAHSLPMAAAGIASFSSRRRPGSSCGSAGMSQLSDLPDTCRQGEGTCCYTCWTMMEHSSLLWKLSISAALKSPRKIAWFSVKRMQCRIENAKAAKI